MSRFDSLARFIPSILDRLTDPVGDTVSVDQERGYLLAQMLESVREDLEELLNTRQTVGDLDPALTRAAASVLGYGLPDVTSLNAITAQQRDAIARQLEDVIARYEPRLTAVRVALLDPTQTDHQTLRCRIEARFAMDPAPDVVFDSVLDVTTGRHAVRQAGA